MDYQCVVVYTIINIQPPEREYTHHSGCFNWIRSKIKRFLAVYLRSLDISAINGLTYGNQACLYYKQGLLDLAIRTYRRAIELYPNFPDAYCNLANALKEKGHIAEAVECYNAALQLCPWHVDSLNNLGNVKREEGNIVAATTLYHKALEVHPDFAATHSNLASLLQQQGKLPQALEHYKHAINIQPYFADAYSNMGNALREMNDLTGALRCFKKAIKINPKFPDAYCNLGSIYKEMGNIEMAVRCYQSALQIKPYFPDAYCSLVHSLQIICDWTEYCERMERIVRVIEEQLQNNNLPSVHPHHTMLYPLTAKARKAVATHHSKLYLEKMFSSNSIQFEYQARKGRLKIGYVSSDFGNHPTSHLMQSIPGYHDRSKVEVYCYALNPSDGTTFRSKVKNEADHFIDLSLITDHFDAAKRVNDDHIQILINMNGYTKGARNELFALKPAPIQVMWLGYPGTSGANYMDYIITDRISSPQHDADSYSEKLAYMPHTYFIGDHKQMFPHLEENYMVKIGKTMMKSPAIINCNPKINLNKYFRIEVSTKLYKFNNGDEQLVHEKYVNIPDKVYESLCSSEQKVTFHEPEPYVIYNGSQISSLNKSIADGEEAMDGIVFTSRKQYNLPDDAIVYCNFNQLYKNDPMTMEIWINVLKAVPNSILWLLCFPANGQKNIIEFAAKFGLTSNRIHFSDIASKEEHVRRGQLADVCLDTPLCNGHTTNMDILWTGTPVVTLPGKTLASRVAASQLTALECNELIATSRVEYQDIAIKLGFNHEYREYITAKLRSARLKSSLFDCKAYASDLEDLYAQMLCRYENNLKPENIIN